MSGPERDEQHRITQRILVGARWASVLQLSGQVISWLSTIVVIRFLLPEDYGLYAMLEAPLELLLLLGVLGLDVALVRAASIEAAAVKAAFGLLLGVGTLFFSVFFFGAPYIADYYRNQDLLNLARALAFVFILLPFRVIPNAMLDRELQFKSRAQLELVAKVVSAAATLALAVAGAGFWSLAAGVIVDRTLYAVLVAVRHPWMVMPSIKFNDARSLLVFGGITALAGAIQMITSKGVGVVAAPVLGAAEFGIYAVATQFAMLPLAKAMPILNPLLIPAFSRFRADPATAARHLEEAIRISSLILMPLMIGLASLSTPFVSVVFGENWHSAALPLALMSCIMPLRLATIFLRSVLVSLGRPGLCVISVLIPFLLVLPSSYVAAHYGALSVVGLWAVVEPIVLLATLYLARGVLPFSAPSLIRAFRPAATATVIMVMTILVAQRVLLLETAAAVHLTIGILLGGASYIGVLAFWFQPQLNKALSVVTGRKAE